MSTSTGRWPVILSGRAIRELRLLSEDKKTLEIVRTKFKELSHGQFTADNYLPVRGSTEHIPIYRARLSNDLRIIYLIDLVSDGQNLYDHQVIKVFSVSSRARVNYDFWVKVSKYLVKQGPDYRKRCIQRDVLETRSGSINVPARFNHQDYVLSVADPGATDTEANMRELHEAVVLEKFSPVTKSLYNSILADMEAVLPMALKQALADERRIVKHHGTSVVIGRSGTGKTTALIYKMRANAQLGTRSENSQPIRQLFVTRSKVLTQHIASNYRGLAESSEIAFKSADELEEMRKANQKYQNRELVEFDNEVDLRDDLPRQFSQLTDAHFPLFVSFDKLCDLLEADISTEEEASVLTRSRWYSSRVITFNDFKHQYWPTFDYKLVRHLDPALVYSEILGVIKGYGHTLSKEEYISGLSHKKSPLLANSRHEVYQIFETYTKQRLQNNDIDIADRTQAILSHYKLKGDLGHKVDYIFVDEVQDHLMADVYLLQSLCSNLDGGYWCGDTAQTISIGSSFRIKDLKAFIYESMISNKDGSDRRRITAPFSTFELTVNFRSHGGIVRYAASIVELIYTLFPSSIDHMQPESAKTPGEPPLFFMSSSQNLDDSEALFVSSLLGGKPVEQASPFGAEQAIIVRSESTAQTLNARLQKRCTVLTLRDTKGLEFDDLILYNFFAESETPISTWRIILGLVVREDNGRIQYTRPELSTAISPVLCSELKQLYVAVTRARHRCWLWDSGTTIDLVRFWGNLGLLTISGSLDELSQFAESSKDLRQWSHRGQEFFSTGLYALAASCFERAGQEKEAIIANAYHHMSEAKTLPVGTPESKNAFIEAAQMMQACAMSSNREYAAHSSATLWYHAATCFESAKDVSRASLSYCNGGFYDQAALVCFQSKDMGACLQVWLTHRTRMDAGLAQKIKEVTSVYFLRERKYSDLAKLFDGSIDRCIEFARSLKFTSQVKELLRQNRQFRELAEVYLEDGLPAEAIRCLGQNFSDRSTIEQSENIVSGYLWANFGIEATPSEQSMQQAAELIKISQSSGFTEAVERRAHCDAMLFERIIARAEFSLDMLQNTLPPLDPTNEEDLARIILIQHHVLKADKWITSATFDTFTSHLQEWVKYTTNIASLQNVEGASHHTTIRRLFGLSDITAQDAVAGRSIQIPYGSLLQAPLQTGRLPSRSVKKSSSSRTVLTPDLVCQRIRTFLAEHLKKGLLDIHSALLCSPWTQSDSHKVTDEVVSSDKFTYDDETCPRPTTEELIRSLSSVFLLLNPVKGNNAGSSSQNKTESEKIQVRWILRLFAVVFPETGAIRNPGITPALLGPEVAGTIRIWIDETLESLDPTKHKTHYISLLVACLALASELYPDRIPAKVVPVPQWKKGTKPAPGCLWRPDVATGELYILFRRDSTLAFHKVVDTIENLINVKAAIDISILVHLVEEAVREVILSVRTTPGFSDQKLSAAFSGLIAPVSWTTSLLANSKQVRLVRQALLDKLLGCMKRILTDILSGLPDRWKPMNQESRKISLGSLAARLLWAMCFVAVNLPQGHRSLPMTFDAIKPAIIGESRLHGTLVKAFAGLHMDVEWEAPFHISSQQACLWVLAQTFKHEDIVMLSDCPGLASSAQQYFVHRVVLFKSLYDLRSLFGITTPDSTMSTNNPLVIEPPSHELPMEPNLPPHDVPTILKQTAPGQLPSTEPTPTEVADENSEARDEAPPTDQEIEEMEHQGIETVAKPVMTLEEAVLLIQMAWKRAQRRRQPPPPITDFDDEGQLYLEYAEIFPQWGTKMVENVRDRISWRLVRGPCLYMVMALRMLNNEMIEYAGTLDSELGAPDLDPHKLAKVQQSIHSRKEKLSKQRKDVDQCSSSEAIPQLFKASNLNGVKRHTKLAWDAFMLVKNSGTLPQDEDFKYIEALMSRGREIVLKAIEQYHTAKAR